MSRLNVRQGLRETLIDPVVRDAKDGARELYWMQRAARTRYPLLDAALNFVPYAGVAASADDYAHEMRQGGGAGAAANAVEFGVNPTTMGATARRLTTPMVVPQGNSMGRLVGLRGAVGKQMGKYSALGGLLTTGGGYYGNAQQQANKQYGSTGLRDISRQLQDEYYNQ